jgi:SAM-dependent methyltransferase
MDKPEFKYVDANANIRESHDSNIMLKTDEEFVSGDGIVEISTARWLEAQDYEYSEWMIRGLQASDGGNHHHAARFDNYQSIKGIDFKNLIELGCGIYTNLRLIYDAINLSHETAITLLDPLAEKYKRHPFCTYNGPDQKWNTPTVINSSIESFDVPDKKYDLVIMINVLEHCMSIPTIFDQVLAMTAPGGHFVFSDVYFKEEVVKEIASHVFNAGHPIRVTDEYLLGFLSKNFDAVFEKHYDEKVAGRDAKEVYFIGTKK